MMGAGKSSVASLLAETLDGFSCVDVDNEIENVANKKISDKLYQAASQVPGVISIHNFRIRYIGNDLQVLLHIVVDANMSLFDAHELSERVEQVLIDCGENVVDAMVHIDPYDSTKDMK